MSFSQKKALLSLTAPNYTSIPMTVSIGPKSVWQAGREISVVTVAGLAYTPLAVVIAYSSPALNHLQAESFLDISPETGSWFTSLGSLGAAVGTLLGGPVANRFGRRTAMFAAHLFLIFSWLFLTCSSYRLWPLMLGRLLTGISSGTLLVIIPVYVAEITSAKYRGTLQSVTALIYQLGYVFTYLIGAFATYRWLTVACLVHVLLTTAGIPYLPESPRWLVSHARDEEAENTLRWLRRRNDVFDELNEIKARLKCDRDKSPTVNYRSPKVYKPLLLSIGLMVILVSTGIDVVLFYTVSIFKKVTENVNVMDSGGAMSNPYIETVIMGAAGMLGVVASSYFVDRCGRKPILIVSGLLIFVSMGVLATFFYFLDNDSTLISRFSWIPLLCLLWFLISYNIGWGGVPYALSAEMLPTEARAVGSGLCFTLMWILGFLWTKSFVLVQDWIGTHGMFWTFSASGLLGVLYVHFLIPETKGKSLEQIEQIFCR